MQAPLNCLILKKTKKKKKKIRTVKMYQMNQSMRLISKLRKLLTWQYLIALKYNFTLLSILLLTRLNEMTIIHW